MGNDEQYVFQLLIFFLFLSIVYLFQFPSISRLYLLPERGLCVPLPFIQDCFVIFMLFGTHQGRVYALWLWETTPWLNQGHGCTSSSDQYCHTSLVLYTFILIDRLLLFIKSMGTSLFKLFNTRHLISLNESLPCPWYVMFQWIECKRYFEMRTTMLLPLHEKGQYYKLTCYLAYYLNSLNTTLLVNLLSIDFL